MKKKVVAVILAAALLLALACPSFADNEQTNYLTGTWQAAFFAGDLAETEEDGVKITTYTPVARESWFSPYIYVYKDIKKIAEGKDYIEVIFSVEIRGVFNDESKVATCDSLLRAINPNSGSFQYSAADADNWKGSGSTWAELYEIASDGDGIFNLDAGGNNMAKFEPKTISITADDWTLFESDPVYIPTSSLDDELFGEWIWCFDMIDYGVGLTALQFRNPAIYDDNEARKTPEPTEAPTEDPNAPTEAPTEETVVTEPAATKAPEAATDKPETATDKPGEKETDNKKSGNTGFIIGIIAGVVVLAAIIIAVVVSKKKKGGK